MRRNLYIIGAGGFGRELEGWLGEIESDSMQLAGFLDDDPAALQGYPSDLNIVGAPLSFEFKKNDLAIFGLADPAIKQGLYLELCSKVEFLTFVHSSVVIGKNVRIGKGSVICPYCILTANIDIDSCVTLNCQTIIGHDVHVGSYTSTMTHVSINGKCKIQDSVYMGCGVIIPPSKKIGQGAKLGLGSVIVKDVKPHSTVFGNPAKVLFK